MTADELVATPPPAAAPVAPRAIAVLLKIADAYLARNAVRQAIEMYFDVLAKYPDRPESDRARERLMGIAEGYEARGEFRQARAICERLL